MLCNMMLKDECRELGLCNRVCNRDVDEESHMCLCGHARVRIKNAFEHFLWRCAAAHRSTASTVNAVDVCVHQGNILRSVGPVIWHGSNPTRPWHWPQSAMKLPSDPCEAVTTPWCLVGTFPELRHLLCGRMRVRVRAGPPVQQHQLLLGRLPASSASAASPAAASLPASSAACPTASLAAASAQSTTASQPATALSTCDV